jgi:hypothetical protein
LLLYADLAHAGDRPPAHLPVALMCHAVRSAMAQDTAPASSALEISSPWPHLRRERASFCYICAATGWPLPHLHGDMAHPCHTCTGSGLTVVTSAPGRRSSLRHLPRSSALSHRTRIRPSHQHLSRDWAHSVLVLHQDWAHTR